MGVGMDAGLDPEEHPLMDAPGSADGLQPLHFLIGIDDDGADAAVHAHLQLGHGLVVAVEMEMLGIEAGLQRGIKLAAGDHVGVDTLGLEDPVDELGA